MKAPAKPGVEVIGLLESCFQEKFGTPRQPLLVRDAWSRLRILPRFQPLHSLQGLAGFSHVWIISWMHLTTNKVFLPKIHPPRLKGAKMGVFATRSPHRPSPIGLSLAKIEKVEGDTVYLSGLDLVNGTPVLDIKPYLPLADHAAGAGAGWTEDNAFPELEVKFSAGSLSDLARIEKTDGLSLRVLIADTLRHDPRNHRDKSQMEESRDMGFFIANHDVHFSVSRGTATVLRIETGVKFEKKFRREKPAPK